MASFDVNAYRAQLAADSSSTTVSDTDSAQAKANKIYQQNQQMGKEQFLNLLITQLRNQDPLKPMDNTEFIAQMAQFSALEQMQQLNQGFSQMKASSMIGKYVTATYTDETTGDESTIQGTVDYVKTKDGTTYLNVDGKDITPDNVQTVEDASESLQVEQGLEIKLLSAENMIGKDAIANSVTTDSNGKQTKTQTEGIVTGMKNKNGSVYVTIKNNDYLLDDIQSVQMPSTQTAD